MRGDTGGGIEVDPDGETLLAGSGNQVGGNGTNVCGPVHSGFATEV